MGVRRRRPQKTILLFTSALTPSRLVQRFANETKTSAMERVEGGKGVTQASKAGWRRYATMSTSQATWVEVPANGAIISKKVQVGREGGVTVERAPTGVSS